MIKESNQERPQNLVLAAMLFVVFGFTTFQEGYVHLISPLFGFALTLCLGIIIWLSLSISTKSFLVFILTIFMIEYVKETIGIRSGMWTYHGLNGHYTFGVSAWVLAGLSIYTLATKIVTKQIQRIFCRLRHNDHGPISLPVIPFPLWLNLVMPILTAAIIPLTLGKYWNHAGGLFLLFYAMLLAFDISVSLRIPGHTLASLIITSILVGLPSEYLGSVSSYAWTFTYNPDFPPVFLIFGCWPLEILAQYGLSDFLTNEKRRN